MYIYRAYKCVCGEGFECIRNKKQNFYIQFEKTESKIVNIAISPERRDRFRQNFHCILITKTEVATSCGPKGKGH